MVYAQNIPGKVKALIDSDGSALQTAGPSCPVEILGFESTPAVGCTVTPVKQEIIVKVKPDVQPGFCVRRRGY